MTAIGIEIVGFMMFIRVWAMYRDQRAAVALAVILLLAWIGITAWLLSGAGAVSHPDRVHSCTMVFNSNKLASASAWLPLMYDTSGKRCSHSLRRWVVVLQHHLCCQSRINSDDC